MASITSLSQLSQELIDLVIDHVAAAATRRSGEPETLRQCALVCQSFRPPAQRHLFSVLNIGHNFHLKERQRMDQLLGIMQNNPCIAKYMKHLSLKWTLAETSFNFQDQTVIDVMQRIAISNRALRRLTIQGQKWDPYEYGPENPRELPFLPAVAPSITSLSIHELSNISPELVTNCINLADLELLDVNWHQHRLARTPGLHPHMIRLQSLTYSLSHNALDRLLALSSKEQASVFDLSKLQSLTVYIHGVSDLDQKIINDVAESLEELHVFTGDRYGNTPALDLGASTRLRRLYFHDELPGDKFTSVCQMLSTVRPKSLETICVNATVKFMRDDPPELVFDADWAFLCAQVARATVDRAPRFRFKLVYQYKDKTMSMWRGRREARLGDRCNAVLDRLRRERLAVLEDDPRFVVALSYAIKHKYVSVDYGDSE